MALLEAGPLATSAALANLSDAAATAAPAPDEWSAKEVISHLCDFERVFAYRALNFSRRSGLAPIRRTSSSRNQRQRAALRPVGGVRRSPLRRCSCSGDPRRRSLRGMAFRRLECRAVRTSSLATKSATARTSPASTRWKTERWSPVRVCIQNASGDSETPKPRLRDLPVEDRWRTARA
jgi:hypothetical protein